jgi:uncharacterized protein (TIGR00255 family)
MLLSMTGHGHAQHSVNGTTAWVEIRSVNNRYLKLTINGSDRLTDLEPRVREIVQQQVRRGTVHITVGFSGDRQPDMPELNTELLRHLFEQVKKVDPSASIAPLLSLPGVVQSTSGRGEDDQEELWSLIRPALHNALEHLAKMRQIEGESMTQDLLGNCRGIEEQLALVVRRAPEVVTAYSQRLQERISQLLAANEVNAAPVDVIREVGLFADRCDISEEAIRLQAHIDQFRAIVAARDSDGRKLEFLTQELLREANTIGSKANDTAISRCVVEIKTAIERIREMVQNVE